MVQNPNPLHDPNRLSDLDVRTTPVDRTRSKPWVGWIAAIAAIAVVAFAYTLWTDTPGSDLQTTASTTNSEPASVPAKPTAPADNSAAPAPATPPAAPAQQ
ncbi:hypothetical protein [Rhizobium sullae]|uniref:Uncharacterized protein n=1 Tax=Rhizobium sullae TaxID=50338 RepID=A0A4V2V7T7_RHISU|nr:hypothetical protein [Rhizobium sullae]TCU04515.1 hypothetical protein EV132_13926 [Rhizobium sullae]